MAGRAHGVSCPVEEGGELLEVVRRALGVERGPRAHVREHEREEQLHPHRENERKPQPLRVEEVI